MYSLTLNFWVLRITKKKSTLTYTPTKTSTITQKYKFVNTQELLQLGIIQSLIHIVGFVTLQRRGWIFFFAPQTSPKCHSINFVEIPLCQKYRIAFWRLIGKIFFCEELFNIIVLYDITSLFTNVPLDETIILFTEKAFSNNWFNATYNLNITKSGLIELLTITTKDQLFPFNGKLYERSRCVGMGSLIGPLMANTLICSL